MESLTFNPSPVGIPETPPLGRTSGGVLVSGDACCPGATYGTGNCNQSDHWVPARIRSSRVGFPPVSPRDTGLFEPSRNVRERIHA
jgi:hypothetical protein